MSSKKPPIHIETYADESGAYRWRIRHKNSLILADGGQGYSRKIDLCDALKTIQKNLTVELLEEAFAEFYS